jgi:hypothetical protein
MKILQAMNPDGKGTLPFIERVQDVYNKMTSQELIYPKDITLPDGRKITAGTPIKLSP